MNAMVGISVEPLVVIEGQTPAAQVILHLTPGTLLHLAPNCTLHIAHCTLHIAHCTLHIAHCTLRIAHCTLHIAHCTLHIAPRRLRPLVSPPSWSSARRCWRISSTTAPASPSLLPVSFILTIGSVVPIVFDVLVPIVSDVLVLIVFDVLVPIVFDVHVPIVSNVLVPIIFDVHVPIVFDVHVPIVLDVHVPIVLDVHVPIAVFPGLVFIEKLQNNDLAMTSFVALRRPNDDHLKVLGMTSLKFCVVLSYKFWILNVQCP